MAEVCYLHGASVGPADRGAASHALPTPLFALPKPTIGCNQHWLPFVVGSRSTRLRHSQGRRVCMPVMLWRQLLAGSGLAHGATAGPLTGRGWRRGSWGCPPWRLQMRTFRSGPDKSDDPSKAIYPCGVDLARLPGEGKSEYGDCAIRMLQGCVGCPRRRFLPRRHLQRRGRVAARGMRPPLLASQSIGGHPQPGG